MIRHSANGCSTASHWAGSARSRRWRPRSCSSPRPPPRSSPARRCSSMAAGPRGDRCARDLLSSLGGVALACPLAAPRAAEGDAGDRLPQCQVRPARVAPFVAAFRQGLSETGYVEGQNVAIEYRWAEGHYDRLPALAADLVGRKVDVIAASGGLLAALAAKSATSTIPIVFIGVGDPVAASAWSPVSPGRAATSRASASSPSSSCPSGSSCCPNWFPRPG